MLNKKPQRGLPAVMGAALLLGSATGAEALEPVIYDNGIHETGTHLTSNAFPLPFGARSVLADDFQLSNDAILTDIHWRGFHNPDKGHTISPQEFRIVVLGDTQGIPDNANILLDETLYVGTDNQEIVGLSQGTPSGQSMIDYWVLLEEGIELEANTTYWLSIASTSDEDQPWHWHAGSNNGVKAFHNDDPEVPEGPEWIRSDGPVMRSDMAFSLTGVVVPEPGQYALLGGLLSAACLLGRQRQGKPS